MSHCAIVLTHSGLTHMILPVAFKLFARPVYLLLEPPVLPEFAFPAGDLD